MNSDINEDFEDLLLSLVEHQVEFLIVGAYALSVHGVIRATEDIDVLIRPSKDNSLKVVQALHTFGAPLQAHQITASDFQREEVVYQIGLPPRRIDILTSISGVTYDEAAQESIKGQLGSAVVHFIGKQALLKNKQASGRDTDLADVKRLQELPDV